MNSFHPRHALLALLLLIVLILLPRPVMSAPSASLFDQRCENEMRPRFDVLTRMNGFAVHNTVSSPVLNTRATYAVAGAVMMGITARQGAKHSKAEALRAFATQYQDDSRHIFSTN